MRPTLRATVRTALPTALLLALLAVGALPALAGGEGTFATLVEHYEPIREALLHDNLDGVPAHAEAMAATARALHDDFSAERAGVAADSADSVKAALPEIASAADDLAAAGDLEEARSAFGELSGGLVLYWQAGPSGDHGLMAGFCPMVDESWLQPEGELGNPYMGQRMPTCGKKMHAEHHGGEGHGGHHDMHGGH